MEINEMREIQLVHKDGINLAPGLTYQILNVIDRIRSNIVENKVNSEPATSFTGFQYT